MRSLNHEQKKKPKIFTVRKRWIDDKFPGGKGHIITSFEDHLLNSPMKGKKNRTSSYETLARAESASDEDEEIELEPDIDESNDDWDGTK